MGVWVLGGGGRGEGKGIGLDMCLEELDWFVSVGRIFLLDCMHAAINI